MADKDHTPSNLFHLAASSPDLIHSVDPEWNKRCAAWLRLNALSRANIEFGPMGKASNEYYRTEFDLEQKYGKNWRRNEKALAEFAPASDRVDAEEEAIVVAFFDPMEAAAIELAVYPAPNLAAALFKIELIKREELHCTRDMPRDAWDIVTEDMARLAA